MFYIQYRMASIIMKKITMRFISNICSFILNIISIVLNIIPLILNISSLILNISSLILNISRIILNISPIILNISPSYCFKLKAKKCSVPVPSKMMASKKKHLIFYCHFIYFTFILFPEKISWKSSFFWQFVNWIRITHIYSTLIFSHWNYWKRDTKSQSHNTK